MLFLWQIISDPKTGCGDSKTDFPFYCMLYVISQNLWFLKYIASRKTQPHWFKCEINGFWKDQLSKQCLSNLLHGNHVKSALHNIAI